MLYPNGEGGERSVIVKFKPLDRDFMMATCTEMKFVDIHKKTRRKKRQPFRLLRCCLHEAIFSCNANLGEKDITGSCRILDMCKLLCDLQLDYFAN